MLPLTPWSHCHIASPPSWAKDRCRGWRRDGSFVTHKSWPSWRLWSCLNWNLSSPLPLWPCANDLTSLCLGFLIYKMGMLTVRVSQGCSAQLGTQQVPSHCKQFLIVPFRVSQGGRWTPGPTPGAANLKSFLYLELANPRLSWQWEHTQTTSSSPLPPRPADLPQVSALSQGIRVVPSLAEP